MGFLVEKGQPAPSNQLEGLASTIGSPLWSGAEPQHTIMFPTFHELQMASNNWKVAFESAKKPANYYNMDEMSFSCIKAKTQPYWT